MLTLSDALLASLRSAAPPVRRIVSLTLRSGVEHHFVDGEGPLFGYLPSVEKVSPTSLSIDPRTREVEAGECAVTFRADGVARQLITGNYVVGKVMRVRFGTADVLVTDFVHEWRGVIASYTTTTDGEVVFQGIDAIGYLQNLEITLGIISQHPLEVMRQILATHVASDLWAAAGFNFEADTTRSHWSVSRYDARLTSTISSALDAYARAKDRESRLIVTPRRELVSDSLLETPRNAWELMLELAELAGGTLRLDSAGRLEFAAYDAAATAVAHWDRGTWVEIGEVDYVGNIVNRVNLTAAVRAGTSGSTFRTSDYAQANDQVHVVEDTTSQSDLAVAGSAIGRVLAEELDNDWLRAVSHAPIAFGAIADTDLTLDIERASEIGFCGARYRYGFRGSAGGGIAITSASITSNVATLGCAGHWLETGAYITTSGITVNAATPVACTVIDASTITIPLVGADGAMADQTGFIHPEQDPLDTLASGREAVFLICDDAEDPARIEIVRATAGVAVPSTQAFSDPRETSLGQYSHPRQYRYTIVREQFGTTALSFNTLTALPVVFDITIGRAIASGWIDRFAYGAPTMPVRTGLGELGVQIGDVITLDLEAYARTGVDGADATVFWEVVSKEVDTASIQWTLALVRED
jgi:hypothetical protein